MVNKELTPFQRTVAIITVVALATYSAINVFLVVNAYTQLDDNISEFSDIIANWKVGAIVDLKVAKDCPVGYEPAVSRTWPGVDNGCYCPSTIPAATLNARNITCSPFCTAACSASALSVGCKNVNGKEPKVMSAWATRDTDQVKICLKRSLETWADVAPQSTDSCPTGTKPCGATADTLFCTKETDCPITSIIIDNVDKNGVSAVTAGDITTCEANPVTCQVLAKSGSDRRRVTIKRGEVGKLPLAEFDMNEYNMCRLRSEDNVTPNRPFFSLLKKKSTSCGNEGGARWTVSNTITELSLFQANSLDGYISTLENYDGVGMDGYYPNSATGKGKDYEWKLFTRQYIPFKASCRNRMESLVKKKQFVDDTKTSQLALLVIGVVSSIFLGIVLAVMEVQNLRGVDLSCFDGKGEEERTKLKRFKKFVNYGFKGLQLPFQIWAIVLTGSSKALFIDLSDEQCSNAETNSVLSFLATTLTKTYSSNLSALGILAGTLLLDLILEYCLKKKAKETAPTPDIGNASLASKADMSMKITDMNESKIEFGKPPQITPAPTPQPQGTTQPQTIVIQLSGPPAPQQYPPAQQYPPQQYPPQQYPPAQQYPPQQYPPAQQYPPQQYPPQQYPPAQQYPPQQYPPQQYPPQQYPPQQQYPPSQ